jgi:hypothetical protein
MFKKLFLGFLLAVPLLGFSKPEKDLASLARENNMETVKGYCIDYWTNDSSRRDILMKFSSLAETCGCVQEDMKFTVSDDLAIRVLKMQQGNQVAATNKYLSEDEISRTTKEWFALYSAASISCGERFMRRRNQK